MPYDSLQVNPCEWLEQCLAECQRSLRVLEYYYIIASSWAEQGIDLITFWQ